MNYKSANGLLETIRLNLLEDHERCPDGSHWHEPSQKCRPISDFLQNRIKDTETKAPEKPRSETDMGFLRGKAKKEKAHIASIDHGSAAKRHDELAKEIHGYGFHDLSAHHQKRADVHREKSKHFSDIAAGRKKG